MVSDSPDRTLTSSSVVASPPGRLSPNTLTAKLIELREDIANGGVENVELQKFEADEGVSMEEFEQMRDKVRAQVKDQALFEEKTKLKLSGAAVAGAKLLVDETHTTRTMTKKLVLESGIDEEDVLYKGLPPVGTERRVARQMAEERNASVLESFVDFQRQVDFKARLVRLVDANVRKQPFGLSRSDGKAMLAIRERELRHCREAKPSKSTIDHRHPQKETCAAAAASPPPRPRKNRGRGCAARKGKKGDTKEGEDDQRTPKRRVAFNALDGDKIIEKYALEVASDIVDQAQSRRRRRHIAPIPFRIDLMDEYSSEEEINSQTKKKTKEEEEEAAMAKEREIDSGDAPSLPPTEKRRRVPTIES